MNRTELKEAINCMINDACVDVTGGSYPEFEIWSFETKRRRAQEYLSGSVYIDDAHVIREEAKAFYGVATDGNCQLVANGILSNAVLYESFIGKLTGVRRKLHTEIDALSDDALDIYNPMIRFAQEMA